jgi:tetratricopeptide (TPR) repeat protein
MAPSADGPTIEFKPPDAPATLTADGIGNGSPRPAPTDFAPPGYEVLGELGRGGMGVVYRARQIALDRPVALKVILGAAHAGPDQLARFRAEATAAARLQHPNIVQVFEVGEHVGAPFFSLELVEGGTLADRLRGEPQPPLQAADLIRTLARAVEHAHLRGVIHRDLKPTNVLVQSPESAVPSPQSNDNRLGTGDCGLGTLKVTDFGLAKQAAADSKLTQTGAILGTPSYMAPEQAAGDGATVGPAADIYALGTILYESLTGRPPFKAAAVMDTVLQVLHDDPVPPSRLQPKLPRDLETVCLKCLAKKPEQRYSTAGELAVDLDRFLAGEPVRARPTSAVVKGWKWARRHPARAVVLFILAVPLPALLAVMVYLWADARSARKAAEQDKAAALEARDRADRERELAQGYLNSALGTMEKVADRVGDGPLSRMPQAQEERAAVLNDTVTFYESLLRLDSTDPTVRFQTAQAYHRVSRLVALAGRIDESEAASRAAIRLLADLVKEYPDRPAYRDELARAYMFQGHGRLLNADNDGAGAAYRQAIDVADLLARDVPNEPSYRGTLVECHRSLGFYFMGKSSAESERHFREALRLAEGVYADRPDATSRALLASVLGAYGQFLAIVNHRPADAEKLLDRGAALTDPKAGPPPAGGHARLNFDQAELTIRYSLGLVYAMTGRNEQGEKLAREAVREYETLLASQPQAFPYRLQTVQAQSLLARLAGANKRPADAAKAAGRAIELIDGVLRDYPAFRDPAKGGWLQQMRQGVLANQAISALDAGIVDDAARAAAELNLDWPGLSGGNAYNVACVFARLIAKTNDQSTQDEYAAKAMTLLKKAAATGYPSTPEQVEHIRTKDHDLKALRDRPEFREWAKTLKPAKGK